MLWICVNTGTRMQCPLGILQRLPPFLLEAGVSSVSRVSPCLTKFSIHRGGRVLCK